MRLKILKKTYVIEFYVDLMAWIKQKSTPNTIMRLTEKIKEHD
jgi:hypothetical protein